MDNEQPPAKRVNKGCQASGCFAFAVVVAVVVTVFWDLIVMLWSFDRR
jgi:hypothetical protein